MSHAIIQERLRNALNKNNISAIQLAQKAGVKNTFIYDILNGKSTNPSIVKLAQVAKALQVELSYFVEKNDITPPSSGSAPSHVTIPPLAPGKEEGLPPHNTEGMVFDQKWLEDNIKADIKNIRLLHAHAIRADYLPAHIPAKAHLLIDINTNAEDGKASYIWHNQHYFMATHNTTTPPSPEASRVGKIIWIGYFA